METNNEKEFFSKLIKAVRDKPCLYEKTHYNYYNRKKRDEAWQEVAAQCNRTGADCKARWKLLRERFCKYMRRLSDYKPLATETAEQTTEWEYYGEMIFLKESIVPRRSHREKDMSSSLDEPTINEVFINVISMTTDESSCASNSNLTKSVTHENRRKTPTFDLAPLKIERLTEEDSLDYRESERGAEINSTTVQCDTPIGVLGHNAIDELFAKNIASLIHELPIEIKDRFQSNMYAEVFRLRAEYRNA